MPSVRGPIPQELESLAHQVIGAAIEVHRHLGPGFLEAVYEEALAIELQLRGIPFVRQERITVTYKGRAIGEGKIDLLVGDALIIELKAVDAVVGIHTAQLLSYLKTTGRRLGLLINFKVTVLKEGIHRVAL